jgi:hypothetical protein
LTSYLIQCVTLGVALQPPEYGYMYVRHEANNAVLCAGVGE